MTDWILAVESITMRFPRGLARITYHRQQPHLMPRLLLSAFLAASLSPGPAQAQTTASASAHVSSRAVLYASAGAELTQYDVDAKDASLVKRNSIRLPANVQYAWPHPSRKYLYVAWSDGGASTAAPGAAVLAPPSLHAT